MFSAIMYVVVRAQKPIALDKGGGRTWHVRYHLPPTSYVVHLLQRVEGTPPSTRSPARVRRMAVAALAQGRAQIRAQLDLPRTAALCDGGIGWRWDELEAMRRRRRAGRRLPTTIRCARFRTSLTKRLGIGSGSQAEPEAFNLRVALGGTRLLRPADTMPAQDLLGDAADLRPGRQRRFSMVGRAGCVVRAACAPSMRWRPMRRSRGLSLSA